MENNQQLTELIIYDDVLGLLVKNMAQGGEDNRGVDFKVNTDERWVGTLGIRCNHVRAVSIPRYMGTLIHGLIGAQRIAWWQRSTVAPCYAHQRTGGQKFPQPDKKTVYFTLQLSDELYQRLRRNWSEGTFRPLNLLVKQLQEMQKE